MQLKDSLNGYLRLTRSFFGIPSPKDNLPDVGIVGVPYDLTSSYFPGCRFGPDAIRQATDSERSHSYSLQIGQKEFIDAPPLSQRITIEDVGDLEVVYRLPEQAIYDISEASAKLAKHGTYLLFLGGDHFITYPVLRGLTRTIDGEIGIVYLDAHADFYDDMGGTQYSHATTLKRIVADDLVKLENILAYDVRSALPEQVKELNNKSLPRVQDMKSFTNKLEEINEKVDQIYLSLDLDVLSPALVPGVSHPESGGLSFKEIVMILRELFMTRKVQYADLVEFNPLLDRTGVTSTHARDLVKEILSGFAYQKEYK